MPEKSTSYSLARRLREGLEEIHRLSSMVGTAMLAALHLVLNQFTFAVSQFLEIGFTFLATASAAADGHCSGHTGLLFASQRHVFSGLDAE